MAIRDESTGTNELLRDSRYHRAALLSDPETHDLAAPLKKLEAGLRKARDHHEELEGERVEKYAVLVRVDWQLDDRLRNCELEVFGACNRNRDDPRYKEVFGKGVAAIVALRGADENRAVTALFKPLEARFPEVAKRHKKELQTLAVNGEKAETAWRQAETDADAGMTAEFAARRELVRQMQKNEGALVTLFPGDKSRVRSYFRPLKRGSGGGGSESGNDSSGPAGGGGGG